ncbi:MAG: DMT family transporter [Bacteriovoracaceae bacterium]
MSCDIKKIFDNLVFMIYLILSFFIGAVTVLQGGVNRKITSEWGLSGAIFLNSFTLVFVAAFFVWICSYAPQLFPESFPAKFQKSTFRMWYLIPSVCGFIIICGIPALIPKVGASSVFLCIVIGQLFFSVLWDLKYEGLELTPQKYIGISVALLGLLITYWKK